MQEAHPLDGALQYYYYGFHAALVRYRALTLLGWLSSAAGAAGFFLSWQGAYGILVTALSLLSAASGIALVYQSVAALDAYVRVPFPLPAEMPANVQDAIALCKRQMEDVEQGGWQEAYGALRELRMVADRFGVPPVT